MFAGLRTDVFQSLEEQQVFVSCFQSFAYLAVPNVTICSQKASLYQLSHSIIIAMVMVLYYGRLCFVDGQRLELAHHNCDTRYLPCQLSDSVIRANGFCKYIVHRIQRRYHRATNTSPLSPVFVALCWMQRNGMYD